MVRKFSEPCLEGTYRGWTSNRRTPPPIRRMSSDAEPRVRRARSAFVTANKANARSGTMLSQRTLEECKKATRKSYPSKMSSTAAFLSEGLGSRRDPATTVSDCVSFHVDVSDTIGDRYCVGEQFDVPCEPGPSKRYFDEIGELGTMMKPTASCSNQVRCVSELSIVVQREEYWKTFVFFTVFSDDFVAAFQSCKSYVR
ncbi:unnamed protein product [Anisakis simplex]|uniref:Uncharacterized protein n=1 Tax=Anisakis simplex TaxID=6269 RepID=A0A0M3KGA5_ANISI|nr:unnamed protein product [Anisakis simplex]